MKRQTTQENELYSAQERYSNGPRARIWFGVRFPFKRTSGIFSFSDRFVFVYFLILIVLTILGAIAVFR